MLVVHSQVAAQTMQVLGQPSQLASAKYFLSYCFVAAEKTIPAVDMNFTHPAGQKQFDYMQAGDDTHQADHLAQEYVGELLQTSAPATYLPVLLHCLDDAALPLPVKVHLSLQLMMSQPSEKKCTVCCLHHQWP